MNPLGLSKRRVAKNAASQIAAFGLSGATKALVAVVVARGLGPQGFGVFMLAWTIASMASFFSPLGLDYRLIRELNRAVGKPELEVSLGLATVSGLTLALAVALGPVLLGSGEELTGALAGAAGFIALSAPVLILRAVFHARERMELETVALGTEGVVSLIAVGVALAAGGGVALAMLGLAVGRAANLVISIGFCRSLCGPVRPRIHLSLWPALLRSSIPMGVSYIFHTLMLRFDVVMLAMFRSPDEIGIYSAATIVVMTVPMIATAFSTSLYPVLSRASGPDDPELRRVFDATFKSLIGVGLVAAAGLTVLAYPIVELFFGSSFRSSAILIAVLAWILPLRFINNLSGVVLNATDQAGRRTLAVGSSALFNIAVNFMLIPVWGYRGALVSTLITEVVLTLILRHVLKPLGPPLLRPFVEGAVVAAAIAGAVAVVPGHVFARAGLGAILFGAVVFSVLWSRGVMPGMSPREVQA